MRVRLFIGSSEESREIVAKLTVLMEEKGYDVQPWTEKFPAGAFVAQSFLDVLDDNDYFIFIMTSDTQITRKSSGSHSSGPNLNVLFEVGAAYGRHGVLRTLIVKSPDVEMITDLSGLITISLPKGVGDQNFDSHLATIARSLADRLKTLSLTDTTINSKLRWLSLMRCKPANQDFVIERLDELDIAKQLGVHYICKGVLWGGHDNFLLFSAPSVDGFIEFITKLRVSLNPHIDSVDSRMVFPTKCWQSQKHLLGAAKIFHMVLISCRPGFVEDAYKALLRAARSDEQRNLYKIQIVCIGILTGDADIFFITAAQDTSEHQEFIQKYLNTNILAREWLSVNTSSLAITHFALEDSGIDTQ